MKIFSNKNLVFALVLLLTFSACKEEDFTTYEQRYVAFDAASASLVESSAVLSADGVATAGNNEVILTILRSTTDFSSPLTVGVTATATFNEDSDFFSAGDDASAKIVPTVDLSSITIPAGAVSTSFSVGLVEDLQPAGDVSVVFAITSVSDNSFDIGQQGGIRGSFSLTIVDDDCPIDIPGLWAGEYEVLSVCAAPGAFNDGFCENTAKWAGLGNVTLTADASDPLGQSAILSGGLHADDVPISFQTCPMTVSFEGGYNLNIVQGSQARILPTDEPDVYGTGSFNEGSLSFNLVVSYTNQGGSNFDEFIIEYKKVN